ncbi:glycoside hydrolase family 2 protein [Nonomuraea sp. NPDC059007]|uniref:glycoside hydrolase family 2 protein n=1 Tax=Nonomuraea sp. NPDC059007 TaxID=3346692 RepID=UPI00369A5C86
MRTLHQGWTLTGSDFSGIPATVPGCVHTDLLTAGLIDDPYLDRNEERLAWIGRTPWTYETTFDWTDTGEDRVDLVCAGLDTVATVLVNGMQAGRTANMHRTYRFAVEHLLREGANTLTVHFDSPYAYAEARRAELGERPGAYAEPYPFIRKMACNFGWDWGPTLVTAGIWRAIGLESWSGARLAEVLPTARADGEVEVRVRVEHARPAACEVVAEAAGAEARVRLAAGQTSAVLRMRVEDPELWWPRGYGEARLYELTVRLGDQVRTERIGFRDVHVDREAFRLTVNGAPVYVKGFNWIPNDCFPARVTAANLAERFTQATDVGANLLRVWGGGTYESDAFYDLADERGLLIWQDFPFACAAYPEEEPLWSEVEAEARDNVARLMRHPSLVLWCGNNENIEGFWHWGWKKELAGRTWGEGFYQDLLPRVVNEVDPARAYWPGSPYSGTPDRDPNDPSRGTIHIWTVWNAQDYTHYANYTPRFVAEFGFQGPPAYATLRRASSDQPLTPDSSPQKAIGGQDKLLRGLGAHLPRPETFDDWHYYTQLNQARAMAFGVERFRALMPYCMGTIIWQFNDCWPVTSWSAVDGDGRKKPLWYGMRRAYAPRLLTFQGTELVAVNDSAEPWEGELAITRMSVTGETLAKESVTIRVEPRAVLGVEPAIADLATGELLVAELDGTRALRPAEEDPEMGYPVADYTTEVEPVNDGVRLRVTARTILRDLAVFPDRLAPDAKIDDQLVTLLPGESTTFHITTTQHLDHKALTRYPVLRCVNERR